jgi:hypothetical protein
MFNDVELITPSQKGNTQDPSIKKMIFYRIERGVIYNQISSRLKADLSP